MEPAEQSIVAISPVMLEEQEIHRLARCIKQYFEAAQKNTRPEYNNYFANSVLIMGNHLQLATQVIESDRQGEFGPAMCDGSNWPCLWPKDGGALFGDLQSFTVAAVALLNSKQPAESVDPSLLAQPANGL
ncbi:hypothetical protein FIE12Z_2262 [Fusarium flagelliforme]|uniref:Uncharacterized protein n=1 Tax=Fusarium flagelliforme TaxID=2675880 RepID=A0A395N0F4_9HYPO|nr:hypothetical protein FIE12Z_2262 [Fusarium flagelliforme]